MVRGKLHFKSSTSSRENGTWTKHTQRDYFKDSIPLGNNSINILETITPPLFAQRKTMCYYTKTPLLWKLFREIKVLPLQHRKPISLKHGGYSSRRLSIYLIHIHCNSSWHWGCKCFFTLQFMFCNETLKLWWIL